MTKAEQYAALQDELRAVRMKEEETLDRMLALVANLTPDELNEIEALPPGRGFPDWEGT